MTPPPPFLLLRLFYTNAPVVRFWRLILFRSPNQGASLERSLMIRAIAIKKMNIYIYILHNARVRKSLRQLHRDTHSVDSSGILVWIYGQINFGWLAKFLADATSKWDWNWIFLLPVGNLFSQLRNLLPISQQGCDSTKRVSQDTRVSRDDTTR